MKHMRAPGRRSNYRLLEVVRSRLTDLVGSTNAMTDDVAAMAKDVSRLKRSTTAVRKGVAKLQESVGGLADMLDDHETRLALLEKKRGQR